MEHTKHFKEFAKYSSLNILGMLGISFYILADTFFISKGIGANGLASLNIAIPAYSFMHGCGLMLGMGGATRYSIFRSQRNNKNANEIFTNTITLVILFAFVFVLSGIFLSEPITKVLGANREIFSMTNTYLKVILLFSPFFMMNNVMICFVRNDGNPRLAMLAMLIGSLSNIIFDYIFVFPLNMGILGAVLATGFSPIISMSILSLHKLKKKNNFHLVKSKPGLILSRKILSLGFPSLITELSSGIVIIVFNIIILKLQGNVGIAAYGVVANLSLVVVSIYTGIAQGVQPLISKSYGYNDTKSIKQLLRYALITMIVLSCIIYLIIFFFAAPITSIFNSENNLKLQKIAESGLKLYFTSVIFVGFNIIISIFFTSTEKALPAQVISLLRGLIIIIPAALLLSALFGIIGVWLAFPAAELLVAIIAVVIYLLSEKKTKNR